MASEKIASVIPEKDSLEESLLLDADDEMSSNVKGDAKLDWLEEVKLLPQSYFITDEMLKSIKIYDGAIEFAGKISSVDRKIVLTNKKTGELYDLQKVQLQTQQNTVFEIAFWGDEIKKFQMLLNIDNILYFERLHAKPQDVQFCINNLNFILTARSNTMIHPIHIVDETQNITPIDSNLEIYEDLSVAINTFGRLKIRGILKNDFEVSSKSKYAFGALADKSLKVPVKIYNYYKKDYILSQGECVELVGEFIEESNGQCPFIVNSIDDIVKLPEKKIDDTEVLKSIVKTAKRKSINAEKSSKRVKLEKED